MRTIASLLALIVLAIAGVAPSNASGQIAVSAQKVCTREYMPVCGHKRGVLRTYPNACTARADGARIVYRGRCRGRRS